MGLTLRIAVRRKGKEFANQPLLHEVAELRCLGYRILQQTA
jgi:hypothetical protein